MRMRVTPRIAKALKALEAAVYEEIARFVAARAEPEEIDGLSRFLRAVKSLQQQTESDDNGRAVIPAPGASGPAASSAQASTEFFSEGDVLVKRGPRKAGAGHYLQRVPWGVVLRLAETIDSKYGSRTFHPAALSREAKAPSYQTYAVLNLLADNRYLSNPKRGSFRRQKDVLLAGKLDSLRTKLPPFSELRQDP